MAKKQADASAQKTVEEKLTLLFNLQKTDSKLDEIHRLRGELPLEVKDLEDEIIGLETRIAKIETEISEKEEEILGKKQEIKDAQAQVKRYEEQQMDVHNNREFEAIAKEIEFQNLNIELFEKRIRDFSIVVGNCKTHLTLAKAKHEDRKIDLESKRNELNNIINETQKEESDLQKEVENISKDIDERLLYAYNRIRSNARNGIAVATVERDACGGCFDKIPPQRQLDIRTHKKIIVCEYCGRILVDKEFVNPQEDTADIEK